MTKRTVFIIDDNELVVTAFKMAIASEQWEALGFSSLDAVTAFTRHDVTPPNVILTDYSLQKGATGLDVINYLHDRFGVEIPALVISGVVTPSDIESIRAAGHVLIFKSNPPEDIIAALEAAAPLPNARECHPNAS